MISNTENVARRLALLAGIVQDRAHHPQPYLIDQLVGLLKSAAATAAVAPLEDGRRVPSITLDAVQDASDLMEAHDFHIPASILGYALAPALGEVPPMKALGAVTEQLARQDFELQKRRNTVLHGDRLNSDDDETVAWVLRALVNLHYKRERLAAAVAVDNARPCNKGLTPFHLIALQQQAKKAAAKAGPIDGAKLIAAVELNSVPAWFAMPCVRCLLVGEQGHALTLVCAANGRGLATCDEHRDATVRVVPRITEDDDEHLKGLFGLLPAPAPEPTAEERHGRTPRLPS